MTYAVKREKVFALQDPRYPDCTPPRIKRSDHRLKAYPSIFDDRTWELSDERQYRALYELVSGSQTCLMGASACHKYVPLEDLIRILMSEKDELIRKLEEELRRCCKDRGDQDSGQDDKLAALTDELNSSREMLRKAMHKLQNIDEIVNQNKTLQCRLRCSEERIKYLEEKKKCLESELADLRSKSQIQMDLEQAKEMLREVTQRAGPCGREVDDLTSERDRLQEKVKELEKELEESKKKEAEIQRLRKNSKDVQDKEEISMENECYKKKLASMRCLEKQIQELKKHGRALADKYKREAQKAAEQMNRMCQTAKELQALREERDSLRNRVKELSNYEGQYNALQRKLRCVEEVIAENEVLNSKMVALEKLEKENEYLKCRLNRIQEMENTAAEDKERIMQLQCAVADQEEEMKDLLCQIERLTSGTHQEEIERLRCELYEKNSKLKLCEEQLAEIPMLEAEIDELRTKLQTCCRGFPEKKMGKSSCQKIEVRLPAATTGICAKYKLQDQKSLIKRKCEEKFGSMKEQGSCQKDILGKQQAQQSDPCKSETMTCEEVQNLLQSSKGIISCVLEDMVEHQKEMEELEKRNKAMKEEIEMLKTKIGTDVSGSQDVSDLRKALEEANKEICRLKEAGGSSEEDVELLKELNSQMKSELQAACEGLKQVSLLEKKLEEEHRARCKAERQLKGGKEAQGGVLEPEDPDFDCCKVLQREVDDLKLQISELNKLTDELKKENTLLRELQKPCPDFSKELEEKCALENLLSLLQAELDAFKGQKLSDECEALRNELKRVMEQNCQLKALVDCYRQRLDLEKKSKELDGGKPSDFEGKQSIFGSERSKSPTMTPIKSITPGEEVSERSKSPFMTPTGRLESSAEPSERSKAPVMTPSGRLESSVEPSERGKSPAMSPDKGLESSAEASEKIRSPVMTPSGRLQSSAEPSEKIRSPVMTPSGRLQSSAEPSEKIKSPVMTPSGRLKSSAEPPEKIKSPVMTPSGRLESSAEPSERGKPSVMTPTGRLESSAEPSERGKPSVTTPTGRLESSAEPSERGKPPVMTPSGRLESSAEPSERGRPSVMTPTGRLESSAEPSERGKPSVVTPSGRLESSAEPSERGKPPVMSPGEGLKSTTEPTTEQSKTPTKSPSGRVAFSPETLDKEKEKEKSLSPVAAKEGPEVKSSRASSSKNEQEPQVAKPTGQASAPKTETGTSGKENACEAELDRLRKELADKEEKLKAKEEEARAAKEEAKAAREGKPRKEDGKPSQDIPVDDELAKLRERLKQVEAENAEKLKALMDQHKKELANRDKAYNDNLNAMKAGYETDIRKLADRHKQGVMKLQGLHEDEVNELNTNYESQMEMMQTQSQAAINDVAKGSAAKLKKLTDQHAKELENKNKELNKLRDGLNKSQRELETLKKKLDSPGNAGALQAKHSRELNAMKRGSQRKLSLLKEKFDEEKKKSEIEVENLKKKMKGAVCDCKSRRRDKKLKDPCAPLDFIDVVEKILDQGLEALSFNEIALVHRKACCALEEMILNSNVIPTLEPSVGDCCPHVPFLEADRQHLLRRIYTLQNDIQEKQRRTQETIINMEVAIKRERCRLMEIKNLLIDEQRKNSELKMVIQTQSQIQTNLKKERDELGNKASLHQSLYVEKSKQLDQEKHDKKSLEEELERLRMKVKQLCFALEMSKEGPECQQKEQIEVLRMRLEQAQNQERKLAFQLQEEAKCRLQLQYQVQALRQSFKQMVNLPAVESQIRVPQNPLDAKSAKEMKNLDQLKEKKKSKPSKKHKK